MNSFLLLLNSFLIVSVFPSFGETVLGKHQNVDSLIEHRKSVLIAQEIPAIQQAGFVFEFLDCTDTPNSEHPLICNFLIENTQEDTRNLRVFARSDSSNYSRIIDFQGNEISSSYIKFGNSEGRYRAETALPNGVPIRMTISFRQSPEGGIRLIGLRCWLHGYGSNFGKFDVDFSFSG